MKDFSTPQKDHVAGIRSFEFIDARDVVSHPEAGVLEIEEHEIVVASGASFKDGVAAFNTLTHTENEQPTEQGSYYKNDVSGRYPGHTLEAQRVFREMTQGRFILKVIDYEGKMRMVGTKDDPMRFSVDYGSGQIGGAKGYRFTFYNQQTEQCYYVTRFGILFMIEDGVLYQLNDQHPDSFSINSDGELEVSGPNQGKYYEKNGLIYYDPDR